MPGHQRLVRVAVVDRWPVPERIVLSVSIAAAEKEGTIHPHMWDIIAAPLEDKQDLDSVVLTLLRQTLGWHTWKSWIPFDCYQTGESIIVPSCIVLTDLQAFQLHHLRDTATHRSRLWRSEEAYARLYSRHELHPLMMLLMSPATAVSCG